MNKKGNIQTLMPIVMALVLVTILMGSGLMILGQMKDNMYLATSTSVANETGGYLNSTGYTLAASLTERNFVSPSITEILNATDNTVVGAGNYTLIGNVLYNATATVWPTIKVTYSYTYDADTAETNATGSVVTAIGSLAKDWIPILIVVTAAGLVIFILLRSFGSKKR